MPDLTARLYYADSYLRSFQARVVERLVVGQSPAVVLDRTAFYPASGGQPFDRGTLNGVPVAITGAPNQKIAIPGGQVVINELTVSPSGTTVNALHATVLGVADVIIASATAGIR